MSAPGKPRFDRAAYLAWEAQQDTGIRHEYWQGEVFAMTGARQVHVIVSLNVASLLKNHLRGSGCRVWMADMQLEVQAADAVFYPDVFVSCQAADLAAERVAREPRVVIEVLSESSASTDRGPKLAAYRHIASLQEYVLIDPDARSIDIFRRTDNAAGDWLLATRDAQRGLILPSLDFESLPGRAMFEDAPLAPAEGEPQAPALAPR